jgi:hypothetical protein
MRKNRLVSFSLTATTLLILGGAGCGELKDIADEILSHKGGGSGGSGGAGGSTPMAAMCAAAKRRASRAP